MTTVTSKEQRTATRMVSVPNQSKPSCSRPCTSTAARERGKKSRSTVPFGRPSASRAFRGDIFIQASIKYVVLPVILILFIFSFPELDEAVSICTSRTRQFGTSIFPLGNWCRLWSRGDFVDQSLKNCVDILHVDIVKIWEQYDGRNVSSPHLPLVLSVQQNQYLSSDQFKINMSHVVKDLAITMSGNYVPSR